MRSAKQRWVVECSKLPRGCLHASHGAGGNRTGPLVIHEKDASGGDGALRQLERRWDGAFGKQAFSTAQRQRIDLEPEGIDHIMLHESLKGMGTSVHMQIRPWRVLEGVDLFRNVSA